MPLNVQQPITHQITTLYHRSWFVFGTVFIRHFRLNFQSKYVLRSKQKSKSKLCILPKCLIQVIFYCGCLITRSACGTPPYRLWYCYVILRRGMQGAKCQQIYIPVIGGCKIQVFLQEYNG